MTTVFISALRTLLVMSKWLGLIDICHTYTLESTGISIRHTNSVCLILLELTRMFVLIVCTYTMYNIEYNYFQKFTIFQFWVVVVVSRMSEIRTIKFINGIIAFDQKLALRPKLASLVRTPSKAHWNVIFIAFFLYYVGFKILLTYLWPWKTVSLTIVIYYSFFSQPCVIVLTMVCISLFYLKNLECRFQTLNDTWKCLPAGLVAVPGKWTYSEIAAFIDEVRLLYAQLCHLRKTLSSSYGQMLLVLFLMTFIDTLYLIFLHVLTKQALQFNSFDNVETKLVVCIAFGQNFYYVVSIVTVTSRVDDKKREMISHLRSYAISCLPVDIKLQIRMFMNQLSAFESDESTACGFFYINMHLIISILVLLINGLGTLLQMKQHVIILNLFQDTVSSMNRSLANLKL